jgi:hypothetical protein
MNGWKMANGAYCKLGPSRVKTYIAVNTHTRHYILHLIRSLTRPVGERSPPQCCITRSAQPEPGRERSQKAGPSPNTAAPYGSVLNPCFEAQPTSPLHKGPPTIGHFIHGNQVNQRVTFFGLARKFVPTRNRTRNQGGATEAP